MSAIHNATGIAVLLEDVRCEAAGRTILQIERLEIRVGERVALIGPNGAGKTTLLRLLSGFRRPATGGCVEVLQRNLEPGMRASELRALRTCIAQVFQGLHLVQRLNVLENVLIGGLGNSRHWRDIARSWIRRYGPAKTLQAINALSSVGMHSMANSRVDRLSGGERQKVAIARMLMQQPKLILADEPTANLDPRSAIEIGALLGRCAGSATMISVVHNAALLPMLAGRVIGLQRGKMIFDCPTAEVDQSKLDLLYRLPAITFDNDWSAQDARDRFPFDRRNAPDLHSASS